MTWLLNRCGHYRQSLSLLASGALSAQERSDVESHLAVCAGCRKFLTEVQYVTAPLANLEKEFASVKPSQDAQTRWATAIKAAKLPQPVKPISGSLWPQLLWRELVWPYRRAWAGLAVPWLAMLWINLGTSELRPASLQARGKPEPETWQVLAEQRRFLVELIPPAAGQPAEPPRRNNPRPRSQYQETWQAC